MSRKIKLSEIADVNMGQSPKSEYYTDINSYIPFLQGNRTFGYKTPSFDTYCTNPIKIADKGSVIMSVRAPVGDLNIAPTKLCIGRGVCEIKAKDGDNQYLYYVLKANQNRLMKSGNGSIFNSINRNELEKMDLVLPSEQNKGLFRKSLITIDDKIELNFSLIKKLEDYSQLLFHKWFVDFNFPNENGEPFKDSGGEMVETDGKMIPKGWKWEPLGKYISFDKGISYKSNEINEFQNGIPMLNLNSFKRAGGYKHEGIKYYTGNYNSSKILKPFDLVVACTDVTRNADIIGSPVIIPNIHGNELLGSCDVAKIKISKPLNQYFLSSVLQQGVYNRYIKGFANGTNVLHLNVKGISKFYSVIPDEVILENYSDIIRNFEIKKSTLVQENIYLEQMRDLLINKLIK